VALATLYIYNFSRCIISVSQNKSQTGTALALTGNRQNIVLALVSVPLIILLLTAMTWEQGIVLMIIGILSLTYMMPISLFDTRLRGFRNFLYSKNIVLSVIWTLATVLIPLMPVAENEITLSSLLFLLFRQFFFMYALTVIYDLRDISTDLKTGVETLATRYGEQGVRLISLASLAIFMILIFVDPGFQKTALPFYKWALVVSGIISAFIVWQTRASSSLSWFAYAVDGAMMLRALLVIGVLA
jgi:4-hydroxybenzoate polyprenyltransferase